MEFNVSRTLPSIGTNTAALLSTSTQWIDIRLASAIRLLLAATALLVIVNAPPADNPDLKFTYLLLSLYTIYSGVVLIFSERSSDLIPVHFMHWLDVVWYLALVSMTGGSESLFFNYFFFAILVASFGWGFKAGLRITLVSVTAFTLVCILISYEANSLQLNRLMMRSISLFVLGFMISRWGGFRVHLRNRLQLLKDVTVLSNARFGTDSTINSILEKLREFFEADACLLLIRSDMARSDHYQMYCIRRGVRSNGSTPPLISAEAAALFLFPSSDHALIYRNNGHYQRPRLIDINTKESSVIDYATADRLATALETSSYVSVPVHYHQQSMGRLYVVGGPDQYNSSAVEFVIQLTHHVMPLIENIKLIDSLASYAAEEERRRIGRDIHDSVIQPYVGLQLGISAVAQKLNAGNYDILNNVEELLDLTNQELIELRRYVGGLRAGEKRRDVLIPAIERFVSRFSIVTGINVNVSAKGNIEINDRLAAEIFQMVSEGLSNVRRHAVCNAASVELIGQKGGVILQIKNPRPGLSTDRGGTPNYNADEKNLFTPRSISERASLLGGKTKVLVDDKNRTVVQVAIPL